MPAKIKEYIPTIAEIKILDTIARLNEDNYYPLPVAIYLIVTGDETPEISYYYDLPAYGTLTSFNQKQVSRLITKMIHHSLIENIYDERTDELYLKVTNNGFKALENHFKTHKSTFAKHKKERKPIIVKII